MTSKIIAVQDATTAGCVTYWTLGGTIKVADLESAWEAHGLSTDELPAQQTPARSLRFAVQELTEKRRLARPLGGDQGWALVDERATGQDLDYATTLRAWLTDAEELRIEPSDHPLAAPLRAAYEHDRTVYRPNRISGWLIDLARAHHAVSLRDTGGVYFIPRDEVEDWRRYVDAIHSVSAHHVYEIPAMKSAEAVEAILAALDREAQDEAADMEAAIGDCGALALRGKAERCQGILSHIESYEALLGRKLVDLTARIETLKGSLVAAALQAEATKEAA